MKNAGGSKEKGAIVVEASIAFTAFIFAIYTFLLLVNVCYIQSKMSVSLNAAAKEISQYCFLYYKLGADELEKSFHEGTEDSKQLAQDTIDNVGTFMDTLGNANNNLQSGDFEALYNNINTGSTVVTDTMQQYADAIGDNPKQFIIGMGKMAGNELTQEAKTFLGQVMAKAFMKKNLKSTTGQDSDEFLRKYRVVDGMKGLDFDYTTLMPYGESNDIHLVVTYEVEVVKLLNIDFKFKFRQSAKTKAWGNGVSQISETVKQTEASVWDEAPGDRGKIIVAKEKANYTYTANRYFDAYDNSDGKNEFITIISANTHDTSYQTAEGIEKKLASAFNGMYSNVSGMDSTIKVNEAGAKDKKELISNPETRTYKVILVVPDDADMSVVANAKKEFEQKKSQLGINVTVEVKTGYGSPSPEEATPSESPTE